jgi:hypothetical protein
MLDLSGSPNGSVFFPSTSARSSRLAGGAFNNESETAALLARNWNKTLPIFLRQSKGTSLERVQAIGMIGRIAKQETGNIPLPQLESMKTALQQGLSDHEPSVRIAAVRSTSEANLTEFIPVLRGLSQQDPASNRIAGKIRYPVREAAAKAALELKQE